MSEREDDIDSQLNEVRERIEERMDDLEDQLDEVEIDEPRQRESR